MASMKPERKASKKPALRRHRSLRRDRRRHVVAPASASEIRETLGLTKKDVDAAHKILTLLGLNG
jgi:hypothetical protein